MRTRWGILALALLIVAPAWARGAEKPAPSLESRFRPLKPRIVLSYDTTYRFLFLHLMQIVQLTVEMTEGEWVRAAGGGRVPAVLLRCRILPPDSDPEDTQSRLRIRRVITAVLAMPSLEPLVYRKEVDEYVNPMFRSPKTTKYVEMYDFESGNLRFFRRDYITGTVTTNLSLEADPAGPGREIPVMLKTMAAVYRGKRPMLRPRDGFRIFVTIDGVETPFVVTTERDDTPMDILGDPLAALRADATPAPEARGRGRPASLWVAPFPDIARHADDAAMLRVAQQSPSWCMVPLVADYALVIGSVRAWLTDIAVRE